MPKKTATSQNQTHKSLKEQAQRLLSMAQDAHAENHLLFMSTFKQYQTQLRILDELEAQINEEGLTVSKEYVKGRKNIYINPCIAAYNKTADSTLRTVSTLIKIIGSVRVDTGTDTKDANPLAAWLDKQSF